jgi:hypothetical protein
MLEYWGKTCVPATHYSIIPAFQASILPTVRWKMVNFDPNVRSVLPNLPGGPLPLEGP